MSECLGSVAGGGYDPQPFICYGWSLKHEWLIIYEESEKEREEKKKSPHLVRGLKASKEGRNCNDNNNDDQQQQQHHGFYL